jgi:hypothetical protein
MRGSVAEEGLPLAGEDTLAWAHFLLRTWRELEDFYWERHQEAKPLMGTAAAFAHIWTPPVCKPFSFRCQRVE